VVTNRVVREELLHLQPRTSDDVLVGVDNGEGSSTVDGEHFAVGVVVADAAAELVGGRLGRGGVNEEFDLPRRTRPRRRWWSLVFFPRKFVVTSWTDWSRPAPSTTP